MIYEKTKRNKNNEAKRIAQADTPRERYKKARREHLYAIGGHLRNIYREYLKIRQAKITYRLEK